MRITIELNNQDINASMLTWLQTLGNDSQAPTVAVKTEKPAEAPEPKKEAPKRHRSRSKDTTKTVYVDPPTKDDAEDAKAEEVPEPKKEAPAVNREEAQKKLKAIAREGKASGIKAILTERGYAKFSEVPDDELAEVLKEAEAL